MVIRVVEFSSGGYKIWNIPKGSLRIGVMERCQKFGVILENVPLNCYSLMTKRFRWFLIWKIDFKSRGTFWHLPITPISKFNNFLWVCWFLGKNLSNCVPPTWKSQQPLLLSYVCSLYNYSIVICCAKIKLHKYANTGCSLSKCLKLNQDLNKFWWI